MKKKKLLFVCSANLQRSPTAESLFENNEKYEAKSAGTDVFAINPLTHKTINWADVIFCMEGFHKDFILENFQEANEKEIINLDISDIYYRNDPELIEILKEKLKKYL